MNHPQGFVFCAQQSSTLTPGRLELPPQPSNVPSLENTTLWTFIKYYTQTQCNNPGCWVFHLSPPAVPITLSMYTLKTLIHELAMPNPISPPDNVPVTQHLIIIGMFLNIALKSILSLQSSSISRLHHGIPINHQQSYCCPYTYLSLWLSCMLWIPYSWGIIQNSQRNPALCYRTLWNQRPPLP